MGVIKVKPIGRLYGKSLWWNVGGKELVGRNVMREINKHLNKGNKIKMLKGYTGY